MTSLRKFERDRTRAELASIDSLIASLSEGDVMTRMSLEERRDELAQEVAGFEDFEEGTAAAALFFGGKPVVGQRGIESEFAGTAVAKFQDLVSKLLVQEIGELGQRGPVPHKAASTMHITSVVRGSFGFLLEEMQTQGELVDTALQTAVTHATNLMSAFGDDDEDRFQSAAADVDNRVLVTAGEFFNHLEEAGATLRLVSGDREEAFDLPAVHRAALRAASTHVQEDVERLSGVFAGALPEGHLFEFRIDDEIVVRGRVDKSVSSNELMSWNINLLNVPAKAEMRIRRVFKEGELVRLSYLMLSLTPIGPKRLERS